jgi:hypothetical protein
MGCAAYSSYEQLFAEVAMPRDGDDEALIPLEVTGAGDQYATFALTYLSDPNLPIVDNALLYPNYGHDVLVRGFIPIVFRQLAVRFTKKSGVSMRLTEARANIAAYINSLGGDKKFSVARIYDEMYYAGADDIDGIDCRADVVWSAAGMVLPDDTEDPTEDPTRFEEGVRFPSVTLTSIAGMKPEYVDPLVGAAGETLVAVSSANLCYYIEPSLIEFKETA